jgi:hypothetical protein
MYGSFRRHMPVETNSLSKGQADTFLADDHNIPIKMPLVENHAKMVFSSATFHAECLPSLVVSRCLKFQKKPQARTP